MDKKTSTKSFKTMIFNCHVGTGIHVHVTRKYKLNTEVYGGFSKIATYTKKLCPKLHLLLSFCSLICIMHFAQTKT